MPRHARYAPGGLIYHVLNRGVGRMRLFENDGDYNAFLGSLSDVLDEMPLRVLGWCVMPNHWHLVLWPTRDGELARFMQRLTITHVRRWVEFRDRRGFGSVYQGRYKSFPVQDDDHFYTMMRYVERNPLRAGLVNKAQRWRWSSLGQREAGEDRFIRLPLSDWPVPRRRDWTAWVNRPQTLAEEEAVQRAIRRNRPMGDLMWTRRTESRLGLPPYRTPGRPPRKAEKTGVS